MSWESFLTYLSEPNGIAVAVGVLWSFVIEYIPKFEVLYPKWKRLAFLAFCLAIPLGAAGLGVLTLDWPLDFEATFWPAITAGALAFGSGTITHVRKMRI